MKTKVAYIRVVLILSGFFLLFSSPAFALSTTCTSPTFMIPDGRINQYTIPASTTVWFAYVGTAGHSYTAESNYPEDPGTFPGVAAFKSTDLSSCAGTSTLGATDTFFIDPDAEDGDRASFTLSAAAEVEISVTNFTGVAHTLTFLVSDTTLFNPLWTTFGGFQTFYRFYNTTNSAIAVKLTLISDAGTTVANVAFTVPAGGTVATRNTGPTDLNVAANQAGHGIITFSAPPGAIQVDGFSGSFGATTAVLPIKIVGARTRL